MSRAGVFSVSTPSVIHLNMSQSVYSTTPHTECAPPPLRTAFSTFVHSLLSPYKVFVLTPSLFLPFDFHPADSGTYLCQHARRQLLTHY